MGLLIKLSRHKNTALIRSISVILLLTVTGLAIYINTGQNYIDLIDKKSWSSTAGADATNMGVQFKPTGRVINHSDTSVAQLNPPINVQGPHIDVSGDFEILASVSGTNNTTTMQLYGQLPIIYDEWRQERASIKIEVKSDQILVQIWDGSSLSSLDERTYKTVIKNDANIIIIHTDNKITLQLNNRTLGSMPDHNIFTTGTIWFGASASQGTEGWTLKSLRARGLDGGHVKLTGAPALVESTVNQDSFKSLALANQRHLPIGTAVSIYPLFTDVQYSRIALGQFSMMTPENSMKPQFIHPLKNTYTYQDADALVDVALKNSMAVHGHALVLGKANPQWMQNTPSAERRQVMTDHITNVVSHFKGKVAEWDVINEPISGEDIDYANGGLGLRKQMWYDAMGEDYIDIALKSARQADPSAKLYLNDFGLEKDSKRWDAMVGLIIRLKARGVPLDGVGFEAHVYHESDFIDTQVLKKHIQTLAGLGIVSRISEIDVLGDNPQTQASQYSSVLDTCISEPTCTSYTTWGISDIYGSTTLSERFPAMLGDSLLWDVNYVPKLAVSNIQTILQQK